tara:strand:+ start:271 stop:1263 length:993 start_codon:yes stop_codon:yes gene_type:complete
MFIQRKKEITAYVSLLFLLAPLNLMAEDWYPSKWGKDDTLGSVNEITPEIITNAAKLVKTGKRYALGMVTGRDTPAYGSRTFELYAVPHGQGAGDPWGHYQVTANDDWALVWFGVGSQIDGLGHVGINHTYYNGNYIKDFYTDGGLKKLGTHEIPPIVTRGIMLDAVAYMKETDLSKVMSVSGKEMLRESVAINKAEIEGMLQRQNLSVKTGDVVLIHTGFMAMADMDKKRYMKALPGIGLEGALYLAEKNIVAVGADTFGTEVWPGTRAAEGYLLPVHTELLTKRGIYILENMVTHELAADDAYEFLFVLGQARMEGAVQMIINPVAIR